MPLPDVSHFSGIVEGEPDSSVYLGVTKDSVVAWVHSSAGHSYVGPDESGRSFVVREADSPAQCRGERKRPGSATRRRSRRR